MASSEWERVFEEAVRLHQAGRLDDAMPLYQHVVAGSPGHGGAMHMLGLIAYQIGRTDTAVDLLGQAAVLDPLVGAVHSNYGLALMARGRRKEAEASFRRALILSPHQGETHASLGQLLLEQGRLEAALASFQAAAQRNPNLPDAQTGLGETLWRLGRATEAEAAYQKAVQLDPAADTLANHAMLVFVGGNAGGALARIRQALATEETPRARLIFVTILRLLRWDRDDAEIRALLERALREGWSRPAMLLPVAADLVRHRLAAGGNIAADPLLQLMLVTAPNIDIALERMLTTLRRQVLAQPEANRDLAFIAALAQQCFINEYVFAEEEGERAQAEVLAAQIDTMLAADDVVSATALLAVACYIPLYTLHHADRLLARAWPDPLEAVLRQQIAEPLEEKRLAAELPALTQTGGVVSDKVRAQYEENPYPRWVRMETGMTPVALAADLGKRFPTFDAARLPLMPDMLFAGCGTGRFTLELSQRYPAASRLAVDLSRASLGYAARKAAEAGIGVSFAQADILRLPQTGKRFAVVESSGVLHHMGDPFAGWKALADCLVPGGVMRVSLYSAMARQPVAEARAWIAREGFAATADDIRAARQRMIAERPGEAQPFLTTTDFYSTSACRDLLFHVEEHGLSPLQIGRFLMENGLGLLGFEVGEDVMGAYRVRFPGDLAAVNLENWAAFEAENPDTFMGMYQFWIQKHEHRPGEMGTTSSSGRAAIKI